MSSAATSLARRRAQEKIFKERENFLKDECKATYVAKWEAHTSISIEKRDVQNRVHRLAELGLGLLKQRQLNIKDLYMKDVSEWTINVNKLKNISTDDRINQMREKALRLKKKREKENQDFVTQCYERRWRDGCDELRTLHSKAITDKVTYDRKCAFAKHTEHHCDDETLLDNKQAQVIDINDKAQKTAMEKNIETKKALDAQMEFIRLQAEEFKQEKKIEEQEKLERWKRIDELEREKEILSRAEARARGEQILIENTKRIQDREKEYDTHRKQDLVLLEHALSKENQEKEKEKNQSNQGKEEAKEYLTFLRDQMVKENEDNAAVDSIRSEEMDKIWTKREVEEQNKQDARKKVLSEVHASRLQQIREKEIQKIKDRESLAKQVAISKLEWERQEQTEQEEANRKKEETIKNMLANKAVMEEKLKMKAKKRYDELLLQKEMQIEEKEHIDRIQKEAGNVVTNFPRRSSKMFS